jgi:hypothetical protein
VLGFGEAMHLKQLAAKGALSSTASFARQRSQKHIIETYLEKAKKLRQFIISSNVKGRQPNTFPFQSRDEQER